MAFFCDANMVDMKRMSELKSKEKADVSGEIAIQAGCTQFPVPLGSEGGMFSRPPHYYVRESADICKAIMYAEEGVWARSMARSMARLMAHSVPLETVNIYSYGQTDHPFIHSYTNDIKSTSKIL